MVNRATDEFGFYAKGRTEIEKVSLSEAEDWANKILEAINNIRNTRGE